MVFESSPDFWIVSTSARKPNLSMVARIDLLTLKLAFYSWEENRREEEKRELEREESSVL